MNQINISQVVLWGHKLHTSQHSYIHYGFYKALQEFGYIILWLDNDDNVTNIDFSNSLFITEGQVDKNIPIIDNCYYVLFNCDLTKYKWKDIKVLLLRVYTKECERNVRLKKLDNYIYYEYASIYNEFATLYMPWATDLLPYEIDENIKNIDDILDNSKKDVNFVGTFTNEQSCVRFFCILIDLKFNKFGGEFNKTNVGFKTHQYLIQNSYIAPAIQTEFQVHHGYIPCRIFKNISYGKMGITNSLAVAEFFNGNLIYNSDILKTLALGVEFENEDKETKKARILFLMEYVKQNHTYLNRIKVLFKCLNRII